MEIPLFPLRTVLFPGMGLPLQVFEPRYQAMLRDLGQYGGVFGVLLIREGEEVGGGAVPYDTGTTATVVDVREGEGGRYHLNARGLRRFRLLRMLPPRPYPFGDVQDIDDDDSTAAGDPAVAPLVDEIRAAFPEYVQLALSLTGQWARGMPLPSRPHALVNALAPWLQAPEEEKQRLIEAVDSPARLAILRDLLDRLLEVTRDQAIEYRRHKYDGFGAAN